jgi:hypothetical protein
MSAPSAISNARQIIIGKTPVALGATDLKSAAFEAATGEIGVFTKEGTRVNTANGNIAAEMEFVIAVSRGAGKAPLVSDLIDGSKVTVANAVQNAVATEQSLAIGYNGTSGLIADVATYAGELYKVTILVHQFMSGTDSEKLKAGYYQSQLTDGQAEIALGIAASVNKNFDREVSNSDGDKPVVAKSLCSDAGAANTGAGTVTVSKGSTQVLFGTDVDAVAVVGDFIRFDESAGGATAVTDGVYKIVAIDAASETLTLDRPYTTASLSAAAEANVVIISAAAGAAANWGVVLDGKSLPFSRSKKRYAKCRFDVSLSESFGSTAAANTASAFEGSGTPEAVAQLENFLARMMSESYEMGSPFIFDIDEDLLADLTAAGYGLITLKWSDIRVVSFQNEVSPKELVIAIQAPTAGATVNAAYAVTATDGLCDLLEAIIPANAQVSADLVP